MRGPDVDRFKLIGRTRDSLGRTFDTIAPGARVSIEVEYSPVSLGEDIAAVQLQIDHQYVPLTTVGLRGAGADTLLRASPSDLDCGRVFVTRRGSDPVYIHSRAPLTIRPDFFLEGQDAEQFHLRLQTQEIPPGNSMEVIVDFIPTSVGPAEARLRIQSNSRFAFLPGIALHGTGINGARMTLDAVAHDFPSTMVGDVSLDTITLGNTGNQPLQIESSIPIGIYAEDFGILDLESFSIPPTAHARLGHYFAPRTPGYKFTTLRIRSNDSFNPVHDFTVTGLALPMDSTLSPTLLSGSSIFQAYPNPFSMTTTVRYTVPERSDIEISVYNVLGRLVRILTAKNEIRGFHTIVWDGRDSNGLPVAGGMYIIRLRTASGVSTKRIMLIL